MFRVLVKMNPLVTLANTLIFLIINTHALFFSAEIFLQELFVWENMITFSRNNERVSIDEEVTLELDLHNCSEFSVKLLE